MEKQIWSALVEADREPECIEDFDLVSALAPGLDQTAGAVASWRAGKDGEFHGWKIFRKRAALVMVTLFLDGGKMRQRKVRGILSRRQRET